MSFKVVRTLAVISSVCLLGALMSPSAALAATGPYAAVFNGTGSAIQVPDADPLDLATFTVEAWVNRSPGGATTGTGSGGVTGYPIVAKGRGETDQSYADVNYFLGINTSGRLVADFEEAAAGSGKTGANHPITGTSSIPTGEWHHVAATYDGSSWNLYVDGQPDGTLAVNEPANNANIAPVGIGRAFQTTGAADGAFAGSIDEVRIWGLARSATELAASFDKEISTATSGLVSRWGMNEDSGTAVPDSVGGNDGTFANGSRGPGFGETAPPPPPGPAPTAGPYAAVFNGTTTAIQVPDAASLDLANFTLEAWVKQTAGGATTSTGGGGVIGYPIVAKGKGEAETAAADVNYFLGIDTSGRLVADFEEAAAGSNATGTNHPVTGTSAIAAGEWHHVAATYDGSSWTLYVDGQPDGSAAVNEPANNANIAPVGIGRAYQTTGVPDGAFAGSIDEVRIWSVARSAAEVAASYDQEISAADSGLVSRWGMNEDSGSAVPDSVGTNDGTLVDGTRGPGFQASASPPPPPGPGTTQPALKFNGTSQYVNLGNPASLGLTRFTIETWMRKDGAGTPTSTGSGGVSSAVPLVTHGAAEADSPAYKNMNWFLGIDPAGHLVADFEDTTGGGNHPVTGRIVVPDGEWHHVAATFDGSAWRLYVDGALDTVLDTGTAVPEAGSTQPAALATSLQTPAGGAFTRGFFNGVLDEARVWDRALSVEELQAGMSQELTAGSGLVARWGMNEGSGTTVEDSVGSANGTTSGGPTWVEGATFGTPNRAPDAPTLTGPSDGATGVTRPPSLGVGVTEPDGDPVDVTFFGRAANQSSQAPPQFTVVAYPDTQYYSESHPATYNAQSQWVSDNKSALNIKFVTHLGDIVQNIDTSQTEWDRASAAQGILESANIPYGVVPGNHDITATGVGAKYDATFPPSRFAGKTWYKGYLGDSISGATQGIPSDGVADSQDRLNKDSYQVVTVGSLRLVFINLEYDMPQYTLDWAQGVINAQRDIGNTEFVLVTHNFLDTTNSRPTAPISRSDGTSAEHVWQTLIRNNCQIHLVLNGHYPGEGRRRDLNSCGEPVHQVLADYQGRANGGDGWLRYMTFRPADNQIDVFTYSPTRDEFETDANSQFTLDYDMTDPGAGFQQIGTVTNVASGGTASVDWTGLANNEKYEWYAVASDGRLTSTSSTWSFTTASASSSQPPVVNSVSVSPAAPRTDGTLTASADASDPDGQPVTLTHQWQLDSGSGFADIAGATTATLDLSGAGHGDRGDRVRVIVTASDGALSSDPVTSGAVTVVNSAPVAVDDAADTPAATAVTIDAAGNDTDADGDALAVTAATVKTSGAGSVEVVGSGSDAGQFSFTPSAGFTGSASLQYTVSDGTASSAGMVTVLVGAPTGCPSDHYVAEYYDGRTLSGPVVATDCVATIDFDWGRAAPPAAPSVGDRNFSIRFTRTDTFPAGTYTFSETSDDGARVYVDGVRIINDWRSHKARTRTATRTLSAGQHTIEVRYFQQRNDGVITFSITS